MLSRMRYPLTALVLSAFGWLATGGLAVPAQAAVIHPLVTGEIHTGQMITALHGQILTQQVTAEKHAVAVEIAKAKAEAKLDAQQAAAAAAAAKAAAAAAAAAAQQQAQATPAPTQAPPPPSPPPPSGGGIFSFGQLEQLWVGAGGPAAVEASAATIAECESGGNPNAYNPSGASGLWQILGQLVPGYIFDPVVNAENAVAKYNQAGGSFAPWVCQP